MMESKTGSWRIITAPSNVNNAKLATVHPAPFVEELLAAVPVVDPLLAPEAAAPVAPDTDAVTWLGGILKLR